MSMRKKEEEQNERTHAGGMRLSERRVLTFNNELKQKER
jgi:hypothetical protein